VPGLRAKPVIDLPIGVADITHGLLFVEPMATLGYDYAGDQGIPEHHIFCRERARTHRRMSSSTKANSGCAAPGFATSFGRMPACGATTTH
jgi:GrpB-like predicted nucleotidyltransferase (UPF0157 family)